jgi:hypothetical protein
METDYKKLEADRERLKMVWNILKLPGDMPEDDVTIWLLDYSKEDIESGFKTLKKKMHKVADPVAYLGTCLRNAKKRNMTPEERAAEISQMRSVIGKIGATKRHEKEISQIKNEFAEVCLDLPEDDNL